MDVVAQLHDASRMITGLGWDYSLLRVVIRFASVGGGGGSSAAARYGVITLPQPWTSAGAAQFIDALTRSMRARILCATPVCWVNQVPHHFLPDRLLLTFASQAALHNFVCHQRAPFSVIGHSVVLECRTALALAHVYAIRQHQRRGALRDITLCTPDEVHAPSQAFLPLAIHDNDAART